MFAAQNAFVDFIHGCIYIPANIEEPQLQLLRIIDREFGMGMEHLPLMWAHVILRLYQCRGIPDIDRLMIDMMNNSLLHVVFLFRKQNLVLARLAYSHRNYATPALYIISGHHVGPGKF